jgi:hypothetical protein
VFFGPGLTERNQFIHGAKASRRGRVQWYSTKKWKPLE